MFKVKYDYFRGINRAKLIREIQYDKKRQEFLAIAQKKNKVVSTSAYALCTAAAVAR